MKKLILLLLIASITCYAKPPEATAMPADYDSLKVVVKNLDKGVDSLNKKFISDNFISIEATKETQKLHNDAFDKMQNSFSSFINKVIGIITIFSLFASALVLVNFFSARGTKGDFEETNKKILDLKKELSESVRNQIIEHKELFNSELEKMKKENENAINELYKEFSETYFIMADEIMSKDIDSHFLYLSAYFTTIISHKLKLGENDSYILKRVALYVDHYKSIPRHYFLSDFKDFIEYCRKAKMEEYLKLTNEVWKKLCEKFSINEINKAVEDYKKHTDV